MKSRMDRVVGVKPQLTLMDLAKRSGIFNLSPSDLVFEANQTNGIAYYDFVLSLSRHLNGFEIYLAKLDARTNLEWFQTINVSHTQLNENLLPNDPLTLLTLGVLTWRQELAQSKVLCLVDNLSGPENTMALEALKRACSKFKCTHHVVAVGNQSPGSPKNKSQESMKLRILLCQSRSEINELPSKAIYEMKLLLNGNPLLCFCFPLL
ncbi:hypothetical protein M3Y97_00817300 [Aphelenchoides bicaudatus]|nr:hypothetical protein M3Y97_00817300 [Aphelenchoides bicaudatus]